MCPLEFIGSSGGMKVHLSFGVVHDDRFDNNVESILESRISLRRPSRCLWIERLKGRDLIEWNNDKIPLQ
jgi:hypothetical protein